jgi:hypothetical protein
MIKYIVLFMVGCAGASDVATTSVDTDDTGTPIEVDTDADTDSDTDADSDADADTDSDADTDTDSDTDADTDSDADTDTDTDSDADTDTDGCLYLYQGVMTPGGVIDCDGNCHTPTALQDPICNDDTTQYGGNFACPEHDWDNGVCIPDTDSGIEDSGSF